MDNQLTPLGSDEAGVRRACRELTRLSINLTLASHEKDDDALQQDTLRSLEVAVEELNQAWSRISSWPASAREVA